MRLVGFGLWMLLFIVVPSSAQPLQTRNVVIVTLDGFRWQEVFEGADRRILLKTRFRHSASTDSSFIEPNGYTNRASLMPFFWSTLASQGQLYGNRHYGNRVDCKNPHLLSYPGYDEMLSGYIDKRIRSNKNKVNPNVTVLEMLNNQDELKNEVAAFTTWNAFPYILREDISRIVVNSANELASGRTSARDRWLNDHPEAVFNPENGARFDEYTFAYAMEYMNRKRPRVLFLSFNETDEHAHAGDYDKYLHAAHKADSLIAQLWSWIQNEPDYQNQTTLIITTDHGRGKGIRNWRKHKMIIPSSSQTWLAVIGPDTPAEGEIKKRKRLFQKQIAKTIAAFMGYEFHPKGKHPGRLISSAFNSETSYLLSTLK